MWMTRVAINHPVFATMVMVALTVLGIFSYQRLRVEAMPDVRPPFVAVKVEYPGASPEQFENDVAKPIENAVNQEAGVKRLPCAWWERESSLFTPATWFTAFSIGFATSFSNCSGEAPGYSTLIATNGGRTSGIASTRRRW